MSETAQRLDRSRDRRRATPCAPTTVTQFISMDSRLAKQATGFELVQFELEHCHSKAHRLADPTLSGLRSGCKAFQELRIPRLSVLS